MVSSYRDRIWDDVELKMRLLVIAHSISIQGHRGGHATLRKLRRLCLEIVVTDKEGLDDSTAMGAKNGSDQARAGFAFGLFVYRSELQWLTIYIG